MHLAILMANTDDSDFADAHPKDGAKFTALIHSVRPDWTTQVFAVKDGDFPTDLTALDGVMITGSPASVHDQDPWIADLLTLIRDMTAARLPIFGACFGHQAIALALGGQVGLNPGGWVFGRTQTQITTPAPWMTTLPETTALYAAHVEQVTAMPPQARTLTTSPACPVGGFAIGNHIYTTQYHPEMTPVFIAALIDHLAADKPAEVITRARASLTGPADTQPFAESIARFFEQAQKQP
jgi:GMP synthase-like glutamine amidotransferase